MNKLASLVFAAMLGVELAAAQPAPQQIQQRDAVEAIQRAQIAAPQGGQSFSNAVSATAPWQPMSEVRAGDRLQITVPPDARWAAYSPNATAVVAQRDPRTDANGYPDVVAPNQPVANANWGALIGRIGDDGVPFAVGASFDAPAPASGVLQLMINENPGAELRDNSGRLPVTIAIAPAPPPEPQPAPGREPETAAPPQIVPEAGEVGRAEGAGDKSQSMLSGDLLTMALVGAGVLAALLLAFALTRPRAPSERAVGAPRVAARLTHDGVAGETLTVLIKGGGR